ncbi:MAG: hypothetical protein NC400_00415 [Clostridium sp.]|nr:hypothetical protein [Clostridium sp.]
MLRVRWQVGCSDELVYSCGSKGVTIAMLDTGQRVIMWLSWGNSVNIRGSAI